MAREPRRQSGRGGIAAPGSRCALAGQYHGSLDPSAPMPASTTGEWGACLRKVFGEYRAPTGVARAAADVSATDIATLRARVDAVSRRLGRRIKILVGKPGLDGHSNGAEQIAVRARDAGMEVVYEGIRLTPAEIVNAALEEVHVIGLSILSGSHIALVGRGEWSACAKNGLGEVPVVVGGIIPRDARRLCIASGVAQVYTPKDTTSRHHERDRRSRRRRGGRKRHDNAGAALPRGRRTPRHRGFGHPFQAELAELLAWRRDVRHFRRDPVPPAIIDRLLDLACLAPFGREFAALALRQRR